MAKQSVLLRFLWFFSCITIIGFCSCLSEDSQLQMVVQSSEGSVNDEGKAGLEVRVSEEFDLNSRSLSINFGDSEVFSKLPQFKRLVCSRENVTSQLDNGLVCTPEKTAPDSRDYIMPKVLCSAASILRQAEKFEEEKQKPKGWLGCGQLMTLDAHLAVFWNPAKENITLVNIGANKGYNLVEWMERWQVVKGEKVNPASWNQYLVEKYNPSNANDFCGSCDNCRAETLKFPENPVPEKLNGGVHIYAMEPSITNYKLLLELKKWSGFGKMTLLHAAASNESGVGRFPITPLGYTLASLADSSDSNSIDVRIFTVDEFMEEHNLQHIHYLKIDTEGYDALVLSGAQKAFKAHEVELIEFEYHMLGPWANIRLQNVVEEFDSFGYDCFLELWKGETQNHLVLLTGCWHQKYEFHFWSNVLCSSRKQKHLTMILRNACAWL